MKQRFEIPGRLDGLNDYTEANRRAPVIGNRMKRENQERVMWAIKAAMLKHYDVPVVIHVTWIEPNMKRDPDNIHFGVKFILDALVELGTIPNDTQKYIKGISHRNMVNAKDPRIIVEIEEA